MGKTGLVSATLFQTKLAPYSIYVVGAQIPTARLPEASFWDTSRSLLLPARRSATNRHDYAIFGGKDHKTGQKPTTRSDGSQSLADAAQADHSRGQGRSPLVRAGDRNQRRPALHRRNRRAAVRRHRLCRQRHDLRHAGRHDGLRRGARPRKSLAATCSSVNRKKLRGGTWDYLKENLDYPYYLVRDRLTGCGGPLAERREARRRQGAQAGRPAGRLLSRRRRQAHRPSPPSARTWAAWCAGTTRSKPGTAPATARGFSPRAK